MGAAPCFFPAPSFALTGLLSSQEAEKRDVLGQRMAQGHHIELWGEAGPVIEQRWVSDLSSRLSDPGTPEHPPTHTHTREREYKLTPENSEWAAFREVGWSGEKQYGEQWGG